MDWKSAPESEIVCYCRNVTKGQVLKAIEEGAANLREVMDRTNAGKGRDCAIKNPRKTCCHMDIRRILDLYADEGREKRNEGG